jgi:hypothetical protein
MADNKNTGNPGNMNRPNPGTTGGVQGVVDTAKDAAHSVADRVSDFAGQAREKAGEWADQAYDAAKDAGRHVQRWAGDTYDAAADRIGDFGSEVTGLVRRHPIPALLIGFGIGLLLGRAARVV